MNQFFIEALDLQAHPMRAARKGVQTDYIIALSCIVEKVLSQIEPQRLEQNQNHFQCPNLHNLQVQPFENNPKYRLIAVLSAALNKQVEQYDVKQFVNERLRSYRCQLFSDVQFSTENEKRCLQRIATFARPWRSKYRYMLVCDAALILLEEPLILRAVEIIKGQFPTKLQIDIEQFFSLLQSKQAVHKKYLPTSSLLEQYRANTDFFSKPEKRIIVTANTSAGKSTLINALIGKPIARTSQEVCTGNVCYLFNKAYEDNNIHLSTQGLNLSATADDLHDYDWNGQISIASYFTGITSDIPRLCIIDTPGVDAALYKEHS